MKATISGQAGLAVVEDSSTALLFSVVSPDEPTPIHWTSAASLFRGISDVFSTVVVDHDDARSRLSTAWKRDRLLQMLLILLSRDAGADLRAEAAGAAEELIASPEARRFAVNRLYSRPLTSDSDIKGALEIARQNGSRTIVEVLEDLLGSQPIIDDMLYVWNEIAGDGNDPELASLRRAFEDSDVFRRLATTSRMSEVDAAVTATLKDRRLARFANAAAVLKRLAHSRRVELAGRGMQVMQLADRPDES